MMKNDKKYRIDPLLQLMGDELQLYHKAFEIFEKARDPDERARAFARLKQLNHFCLQWEETII